MPFSNPVVAGETLVIPAVQSDGFVTGSTGWRITRAGSAEFNDVTVRGILDIISAAGEVSVGKFLVDLGNGNIPVIRASESTLNLAVDIFGGTIQFFTIGGANTSATITYNEQTGSPATDAMSLDLFATTGPDVSLELRENPNDNTQSEIYVSQLIRASVPGVSGAGEVWNLLAGQNGWTVGGAGQRPQYRQMPDGTVMLRGIFAPGTTTNGTVMTSLPAGYRPQQESRFITADTGTGTAFRHINIQTNGNVLVFNAATGGGATSLDGIRFAIPLLGGAGP